MKVMHFINININSIIIFIFFCFAYLFTKNKDDIITIESSINKVKNTVYFFKNNDQLPFYVEDIPSQFYYGVLFIYLFWIFIFYLNHNKYYQNKIKIGGKGYNGISISFVSFKRIHQSSSSNSFKIEKYKWK
jgi:hypothetical protein